MLSWNFDVVSIIAIFTRVFVRTRIEQLPDTLKFTGLNGELSNNHGYTPGGGEIFFFLLKCPDRPWGPATFVFQWVSKTPSPELKLPRSEADHSPLPSAEVKNEWSYASIPPHSFVAFIGAPIFHDVIVWTVIIISYL